MSDPFTTNTFIRERRGSDDSQVTAVESSSDQHASGKTLSLWKKLTPANVMFWAFVRTRERRLIRLSQELEPIENQENLDDEKMIKDGYRCFKDFERRVNNLNIALNNLCNASRKLSSSFHVTQAAVRLEKAQREQIVILFRLIATILFPTEVPKEHNVDEQTGQEHSRNGTRAPSERKRELDDVGKRLECVHFQFGEWAEDIDDFVDSINRLPGHTDKDISKQMGLLATDLKYWASCLGVYEDRIKSKDRALLRYIHRLGIEMGQYIEESTTAIITFVDKDIPLIFQSQQGSESGFLTVSTLFTAVAATTVQFSYAQSGLFYGVVNFAWFMSLGFSIAASVFTLLRELWKDTIMSYWPTLDAPLLVLFCIEEGPLGFLVISIISYSIGLCFFAFASTQSRATLIATIIITGICAFGLLVVLLGSIPECFRRRLKKKRQYPWRHAHRLRESMSKFIPHKQSDNTESSVEQGLGRSNTSNSEEIPLANTNYNSVSTADNAPQENFDVIPFHIALVKQAIRNKIRRREFTAAHRVLSSLKPEPRRLHAAAVTHMQFSPDGKYLATCSIDRTCLILETEFPEVHREFGICKGHSRQISWSPKGDYILTRLQRNIMLWEAPTGVYKKTITRESIIQQVAWFPQEQAFLSVEVDRIVKFIIDEYLLEDRILHSAAITSDQQRLICITALARSPQPEGLKPSGTTRKEKQILVYNLRRREIETQIPILSKIRHVSLSRDDNLILVSYEGSDPPQLWKIEKSYNANNKEQPAHLSLAHTYLPKTGDDFTMPSCFGGVNDELIVCGRKAGDIHIWDRDSGFLRQHIPAPFRKKGETYPELISLAWNSGHSKTMFASGNYDGELGVWTSDKEEPSKASPMLTSADYVNFPSANSSATA